MGEQTQSMESSSEEHHQNEEVVEVQKEQPSRPANLEDTVATLVEVNASLKETVVALQKSVESLQHELKELRDLVNHGKSVAVTSVEHPKKKGFGFLRRGEHAKRALSPERKKDNRSAAKKKKDLHLLNLMKRKIKKIVMKMMTPNQTLHVMNKNNLEKLKKIKIMTNLHLNNLILVKRKHLKLKQKKVILLILKSQNQKK